MKKITLLFMGLLLTLSLAACGSKSEEGGSQTSQTKRAPEETEDAGVPEDTAEEQAGAPGDADGETTEAQEKEPDGIADGGADAPEEPGEKKALVVYYSASGNTKAVAGYLAEAADADLFELIPEEPYSDADLDWTDDESRVVYEHDHPDERAVPLVEETAPGWDSYDTVFIGYPIWWGIAAWPVDGFISANDFTGKTVIPFCTSSSSGLGESGELLAKAAGTGNWLEGERFPSSVKEETVTAWVEGLNLE